MPLNFRFCARSAKRRSREGSIAHGRKDGRTTSARSIDSSYTNKTVERWRKIYEKRKAREPRDIMAEEKRRRARKSDSANWFGCLDNIWESVCCTYRTARREIGLWSIELFKYNVVY